MRKKLLAIALLLFATNLVTAGNLWFQGKSGNYYPKTNVMTAALVGILGQQKTSNFLAGKTVSISPTEATQLRLGAHVTTITNYNPKTDTPPSTTTTTATQTYQSPKTTTRSTTSRSRGTSKSRGRTKAAATTTAYTPPAYTPPASKTATTSRTRGRTRGRTAAATTVTSTPATTPATTTATPSNGRIQELENKVEQLTGIVLQLQQQLN